MASLVSLVVTPIVEEVVGLVGSFLEGEFHSILGFNDSIEKLKSNLTAINAVLRDAEKKQLEDEHLKDWLRKLKTAAEDAADILDTFATEIFLWKRKHDGRTIPTPVSASKILIKSDIAHKMRKISARLDIIAEERQKYHLQVTTNDAAAVSQYSHQSPPTDSYVDKREVFGRENDIENLIDMLLSDGDGTHLSVIPIIGMPGQGKTTLAQLVYNDDRIKGSFDLSRMWVSVSTDFDLGKILRGIMDSYSKMPLPPDLPLDLVKSRFQGFLPGKRFFIVLDDVWNDDHVQWSPLLQLLQLGKKGSKVVVTSRSQKVADAVRTQPAILLEGLPEDKSWSLFKRIAFRTSDASDLRLQKQLEEMGRDIVARCKGLPLAIKAMASLLCSDTNPDSWRRILRSNIWELEDTKILPALRLSYNHLPSDLKQCFAYCSIFPKAYAFDKAELVKLWMAVSFVRPKGENSAEDIGAGYFDMLLARSFFQRMNIDNKVLYRMHDLNHDLALSISIPECWQVKDNRSSAQLENCRSWRHVSLLCQDVEGPCRKIADQSKKLHTLLMPRDHLKNFGSSLNKLLHSMKYIRALDLSSSNLSELPSSIKKCKLLRYLNLSNTDIQRLPDSICNLYNLQTLKLLGCAYLSELPRDLSNLVKLRHLELDEIFWFKCIALPPKIGNITGLHNLQKFMVHRQTGYQITELTKMADLMGRLHISNLENAVNAAEARLNEKERLQKVVFEWTRREVSSQGAAEDQKVLDDLKPHKDLEELVVSYYGGDTFPPWMTGGHLQYLVSISLDHCNQCKILDLDQLPSLLQLRIKNMPKLKTLRCSSLNRLQIIDCKRVSRLTEFFPDLRVLKIKRCDSLRVIPLSPSLNFVTLVDNPFLHDWQEQVNPITAIDGQGNQVRMSYLFHGNILEMKVIDCPKLQALPKFFFPQKLEINGCELLTALPPPVQAQRLQHLALDNNGALLRGIPYTSSLYSLVISNISSIVSLPKLPHLPGLKALHIQNCLDLESLSEEDNSFQSLHALKLLSIQGCKKLVTLPNEGLPASLECLSVIYCSSLESLGNGGTLKSLASLKDLYIEHCPLLQSFPDDGLPNSLQHLRIQNCQQLADKCKKDIGPEWVKIAHIVDLEIDLTESSSVQQPQLPKKKPYFPLFICGNGENSKSNIKMEMGDSSNI